jgi:serine/threonine-protein kinase
LVQDYVDGPSYRDLLNQRRLQNMPFSEAEVRQFLQYMLPVLAHIHAKGIIHRDISPDNILLRNRDRLPVLIDFGVVKEVVTRINMGHSTYHATTVGKPGYAPSEQMQSGRAYPSSDLYALAVTAVVLLTGKEPQDLFDDVNLAWHWQQYAAVSPGLAQVLTKAMSYRPGDRYQSVSEMAQALGAVGNLASPVMPHMPLPNQASAAAAPASQMRTVAVGRPYQATTMAGPAAAKAARPATPSVLEEDEGSVWENPFAVGALAVGLAIIAGIGGWGLVSALNRNQPTVEEPPPPAITLDPDLSEPEPQPQPTPEPTPIQPEPVEYSQNLALQAGESTTVEGSLRANETVNYRLEGIQDQTLTAQLEGEGVLLTVLAPSGNPADGQSRRVLGWTGTLAFTGPYTLQLRPVEGVEQSNYSLQVSLAEAEAPAEPEAPPEPEQPEPEPEQPEQPEAPEAPNIVSEQRVRFPAGQNSILVANSAGPSRIRRYVINLQQGKVLQVEVASATAPTSFDLRLPSDEPLAQSVQLWEQAVPVGGDYAMDVIAAEDAEVTLRFSVRE